MKKSKSFLFTVFMLVLVLTSNVIFAATTAIIDTNQTGSLTIIAREQKNGSTETTAAPGIAGVEYELYKVDVVEGTTVTTADQAEAAIASATPVDEGTTNDNGRLEFTGLELGRYYAKVTAYPAGTTEVPESFLVDIPMTNEAGNAWQYDITVQPKVQTAAGSTTLTVKDDNDNVVPNTTVKVQMSTETSGSWSAWADYTPEGANAVLELTTDDNGQVTVQGLPVTYQQKNVRFRFYITDTTETTTELNIIDNTDLDYVYVQANGKTVVVHADSSQETPVDNAAVEIVLGNTSISRGVKTDSGEYAEAASVGITEAVQYKVEMDLPSNIDKLATYTLVDTLEAGLTGRTNLKVVGLKGDVETDLTVDEDYTTTDENNQLTVSFVPAKLEGYDKVVLTFDAYLNMEYAEIGNAGIGGAALNESWAELTVTNDVQNNTTGMIFDTAVVVTGGLKILKVNSSDEALAGATFKIAATEDDAKEGKFLTDVQGNEIVAVSGEDGYATINGLAYNDDAAKIIDTDAQAKTYYLVETQAPTYTEEVDGAQVTKSYNLLADPVEVTVTGVSHENTIEIVNRKPFELPATGGMGIVLFVLIGIVVMAYAIYKNRKHARNVA